MSPTAEETYHAARMAWTILRTKLDAATRYQWANVATMLDIHFEMVAAAPTAKPAEPCKTCHRDVDHVGGRYGPPCPDCGGGR